MTENLVGRTIGKYRILERLGRGGMADVYKAYQASLDRDVAIKILHPHLLAGEEDFIGRFRREARAAAALRHPNIVQVFDFDYEDGFYYMVMECLDGQTLKERLQALRKKGQVMNLDEALHIMEQVGSALDYAHQQGMVHRDIKPSNIMLTTRGRAVLTDFGIARMLGGTRYTMPGSVTGTPAYMSPEQGRGADLDHRSDSYSLGVVLYEMIIGRVPFDADTPLSILMKHVTDDPPSPRVLRPDLPSAVETVIRRALAKRPEDRYQRAGALVTALRAAVKGYPLPERKEPQRAIREQEPVPARGAQPTATASVPSPETWTARKEARATASEGGFWTMATLGGLGFLAVLACLIVTALIAIPRIVLTPTPQKQVQPMVFTPLWTPTPTWAFTPTWTPTQTPVPTDTPVPTNTPLPPTNTPVLPTNTPVLPTNTPIPLPTNTPIPLPTNTPVSAGVSNFTASPNPVPLGQCTTLEWAVDNVREVWLLGGGQDEGVGGHDSRQRCPSQTTTYTLRIVNLDGTSEDFPLEVKVTSPASAPQFTASPNPIAPGQCTTLEWAVDGAKQVQLLGGGQDEIVGSHDSRERCPTETTTYTLRVIRFDDSTEDYALEVTVGYPDLTIEKVTVGSDRYLKIKVKNIGTVNAGPADLEVLVHSQKGDTSISISNFSLEAGKSTDIKGRDPIPCSKDQSVTLPLRVTVDVGDDIDESKEDNNIWDSTLVFICP